MGILLDSGVLIAQERKGLNAYGVLQAVESRFPRQQAGLSVVTLMELAHGARRADSPARRSSRQQFLSELCGALPIHSITPEVALRAGQIDGDATASGVRIPVADLLIGATALELGFSVVTLNLRDFQRIPGLDVISF
jgi:predicted nucleic acid-binding protein